MKKLNCLLRPAGRNLNGAFGLFILFFTLLLASIFIQACKKEKELASGNSTSTLQSVNALIQLYSNEYGSHKITEASKRQLSKRTLNVLTSVSESALALSSVDVISTNEVKSFTDVDNKTYHIFFTAYNKISGLNGGVVSIVLPNQRLLSYVSIIKSISQNHFINNVYSLTGEEVGTLKFLNGSMVKSTTSIIPAVNPQTPALRSWWGCTKECARETVHVCSGDPQCYTMFVISNLPSGNAPAMGSLSIAAACGIMCLRNVKFDVLPIVAVIDDKSGGFKPLIGNGF